MNTLLEKYIPRNIDDINLTKNTSYMLNKIINSNNIQIIILGDIGCGKTILSNLILDKVYKNIEYKKYDDYIMSISLLKDQGMLYYKTELKNFCETLTKNKMRKTIFIEDLENFNEQIQILFYNIINKYPNINYIITSNDILKLNNNLVNSLELIEISKFTKKKLHNKLIEICENENLKIDLENKDILNKIINSTNYSISNLINFLDKLKLIDKEITIELINSIDSNIIIDDFYDYFFLCKNKDLYKAYNYLFNIIKKGFSVIDILENMVYYIKNTNDKILNEEQSFCIIKIILSYINIFYSLHEDDIELIFLTNDITIILE